MKRMLKRYRKRGISLKIMKTVDAGNGKTKRIVRVN